MEKIGIYSGTFDPIHIGHLAFAKDALINCGLEKVFFLVEPRPRRKQGVKALEHRDEMVRMAIKDNPRLGSIQLGQQRFSPVDTLPILLERFKGAKLYMLMGDDSLSHFINWPHVEELVPYIEFVIGLRYYSKAEVLKRIQVIQKTRGITLNYSLFKASGPEFSSSKIKQQIKKGLEPTGLSADVQDYIAQNNLYKLSSQEDN